MSMKNELIPAEIEPKTFRFVAQHLNYCATAVVIQIKVLEMLNILAECQQQMNVFHVTRVYL